MVKQDMARVNIDFFGISELKWNGMGEFNSDDNYIYSCGQESFRRNEVAIIINMSPKCSMSKAHRVLPRKFTGHRKHPLPRKKEKTLHMDVTR